MKDGGHRAWANYPPDQYTEWSRTSSGGIIYVNPTAPSLERWLIKHQAFGDKYFAEHDEILKWTVEEMRERLMRTHGL